jgi:hypothetical protein
MGLTMNRIAKPAFFLGLVLSASAVSRLAVAATLEERTAERLDSLEKENAALKQRLKVIESTVATPGHAMSSSASRRNSPLAPERFEAAGPPAGPETLGRASPAMDARAQGDRAAQFYKSPAVAAPVAHFEVSGSLLYLQPGSGNLEYATLVTPLPLATPNWANQSLSPAFTPAFKLGFRYIPNESNDIRLSWTRLNSTSDASANATPTQMIGPQYEIGPTAAVYKSAHGNVKFGYDSVTVDAGHTFCADCSFQMRVFGGAEIARIGQTLAASFQSPDGLTTTANTTTSSFTGAGPRLGLKGEYFVDRFQFFGEAAAAGLIGTMQSRIDFSATSPIAAGLGVPQPNNQALTSPNATQVVPSFDARLGAAYSFPPSNFGRFKLEVGYQAAIYMNVINQYAITQVAAPPVASVTGVFLETQQHLQNNFTTQGPYMTANWLF